MAVLATVAPLLVPRAARAGDTWFYEREMRLGASYLQFSGTPGQSLSGSSMGGAFEAQTERGNLYFSLVGKVRLGFASGTASFSDSGTLRSLGFRAMLGDASLGARFNLVPSKEAKIRPYLGGAGTAGVVQLSLPEDASYVDLKQSEVAITRGFELFAGVDFAPKKLGFKEWFFFIEAQMRVLKTSLAGNSSFALDGFTISGGVGW